MLEGSSEIACESESFSNLVIVCRTDRISSTDGLEAMGMSWRFKDVKFPTEETRCQLI